MKISYQLFLCLLMGLFLVSCKNQPFPNAEIVYQAGDPDMEQMGFVNSDGTGSVLLPINGYAIRPKWSVSGKRIFGVTRVYQAITSGAPTYWGESGDYKKCKQGFSDGGQAENFVSNQVEPFDAEDETKVLIVDLKVYLIDLASCEKLKVFVDHSNQTNVGTGAISYFPKERLLLYDVGSRSGFLLQDVKTDIVKLNIITGEQTTLGAGFNPSWSPDGSQIAYVQSNGIYIMNADGSNSKRIVSFLNDSGNINLRAPIPNWSPDGKWLVYHRCSKAKCIGVDEYDIYKVEISTGTEYKIIEHGVYPDWKKATP